MLCINKKCAAELVDSASFCHICGRKQSAEKRKRIRRAKGSGTVYKLSDGRRSRPWVAAKGKIIVGFYEHRSEALEALNALGGRTITERHNYTFQQVYEQWNAEHFKGIGDKSQRMYENSYKKFEPLYDRKFRDLRTSDYMPYFAAVEEAGQSKSAADKLKHLLTQMTKWAMREEIVPTNFATFVKPKGAEAKEKETFSDAEIQSLMKSSDEAAKLVLMMIYTGLRLGELFTLETSNVFENYCIGGIKTEAGRDRIVPIPPVVSKHFAYFRERAESDGLLISGYSGEHTQDNFRRRDYYPLLEHLGIVKKPPHSARHTFASMSAAAGVKPEILQKIMGHADYSTTADVYIHADMLALIEATKLLGQKKKAAKK